MGDVFAAVDETTGAFGNLVQNRLRADMQTAINTGVTNTISGMGDVVTAVTNKVSSLTTDAALKTANVIPNNARNKVTGWFHIDGYGAVGDGTTDDRAAIQAAIDAANTAYISTGARQVVYVPPKTFITAVTAYTLDNGTAAGIACLVMKDGVDLVGNGTIKVKNAQYGTGAQFGVIRSKSGGLSNASIQGITVDGNAAAQTPGTQASNIVLNVLANVDIINTRQINSNGQGIQLVGPTGAPAANLRILNNRVFACTNIGIQVSHFLGLIISGNHVENTQNSIDIYGEQGTGASDSRAFIISNNDLHGGAVGVFCETVEGGVVSNNLMQAMGESGVHINRINGQPNTINVIGNTIFSSPYGVWVTGDTGSVTIRDNEIGYVSAACIAGGSGSGNIGSLKMINNTLNTSPPNAVPLFFVPPGVNQSSNNYFRGNISNNTNRSFDYSDGATTKVGNNYQAVNA